MFKDSPNYYSIREISEFTISLSPNAVQKDWKTLAEFPYCPQESTTNPIVTYISKLRFGEVFSRNQYSNSIIVDFALSKNENTLWVMCKNSEEKSMKLWSLAQVTYEKNLFIHTNLGSFFQKESAEKHFTLAQGFEWIGGDTFDDLC